MTKSPFFVGVLGAAAWAAAIVVVRPVWAAALLLLGVFVIVPMLLSIVATPDRYGRHAPTWIAALVGALPAAGCLAAAFFFAPSRIAGLLAVPWVCVTLLAAMFGARRTLERGAGPTEEACIDAGLVFLAVGGSWAFASRAFERPLGFDNLVAVLTAVHFHFAGFALAVLVGLAGRRLSFGAPKLVAALVIGGVIALAAGIAASAPVVEQVAGWTLALGGCLMAAVHLNLAASKGRPFFRLLAAASGACLATALVIAALYAARRTIAIAWVVDLGHMQRYHGTLNALGFAMLATFAHASAPAEPRIGAPGIPFSALSARLRVGADYFERRRIALFLRRAPDGLMDSLDDHRRDDFDTAQVHPAVRAFYERTAEHELVVAPRWSALFAVPARVAALLARAIGQLCIPFARDTRPISSRLVALDPERDGRAQARGWVRTYADGRAMCVAAYGRHRYRGVAYLNVARPVPFGNVSSVLRMDPLPVEGSEETAAVLTTRAASAASDAGVWFVSRWFGAVKLPIGETFVVAPASYDSTELPGATLEASHEVRLLGLRVLTLTYAIRRSSAEAPHDP